MVPFDYQPRTHVVFGQGPRRRARDDAPAESLARRLEDLAEAGGLAMTSGAFNPRPFDAAGALEIYRAAYRSA